MAHLWTADMPTAAPELAKSRSGGTVRTPWTYSCITSGEGDPKEMGSIIRWRISPVNGKDLDPRSAGP
jgi:hypothetical protein